jgi:hypothetical protein
MVGDEHSMNEDQMLFRKEVVDALAETLEGLVLSSTSHTEGTSRAEHTVVLFHTRDKAAAKKGSPILEIELREAAGDIWVVIHSALGVMELRNVEEVRLSPSTEEAAFFVRSISGHVSVTTVSSHGVLQVYQNVPAKVREKELADLSEYDLRAAVALKIFAEGATVFSRELHQA